MAITSYHRPLDASSAHVPAQGRNGRRRSSRDHDLRRIQACGNKDFTGASIHSVGLEHTDHTHPGNALAPFELVDGSVLSCDLPWSDPALGRFHLENLIYLNGGTVELLDASDTSLYACVDGRSIRVE